MSPERDLSDRRDDRLLRALDEAEGVVDGTDPGVLRLIGRDGLRRRPVDRDRLDRLARDGLLRLETDPDAPGDVLVRLSDAGRARLRRGEGDAVVGGFRRQHGDVGRATVGDGETVQADRAESPLARLARRRDRDGRALISPARFAAGERLRADFTLARMMPTLTSNWSAAGVRTAPGPGGGVGDLTDRALAARDRVGAALAAVGVGLDGVLIDVCCFLKGLETVESERAWPVRSAKVVLDIALGRLADHYGLADEARGRDRSGRLRAWGTGDHRPTASRRPPPDGRPTAPG